MITRLRIPGLPATTYTCYGRLRLQTTGYRVASQGRRRRAYQTKTIIAGAAGPIAIARPIMIMGLSDYRTEPIVAGTSIVGLVLGSDSVADRRSSDSSVPPRYRRARPAGRRSDRSDSIDRGRPADRPSTPSPRAARAVDADCRRRRRRRRRRSHGVTTDSETQRLRDSRRDSETHVSRAHDESQSVSPSPIQVRFRSRSRVTVTHSTNHTSHGHVHESSPRSEVELAAAVLARSEVS